MSDRDFLRARVRRVLQPGMTPDAAADAVVALFALIGHDIIEAETTTLGDAYQQVAWSRVLVCQLVLESGSYQGGPVRG